MSPIARIFAAGAALVAVATAGVAAAQNYGLAPTYGTVNLTAGFMPDPVNVNILSGGRIDAGTRSNGCRGFIADAPDVRLNCHKDKCPNTPKGRKVDANGCELDSDGDGVVDGLDKCPGTPAGRKVNAEGCELDSDGDGVVDGLDKCPGTPAGRKVDANGCELDTDGDGLVDGVDKCPTVFAKTPDGCPLPPAPKPLVLEGVNFDNDEATLRPDAIGLLERAAVALKEWGNVKVEIAGHTDAKASDDYNQALSERRANAVRDFLISKGIAADRLTAKGYGESQPIADNGTEEGRATNRHHPELTVEEVKGLHYMDEVDTVLAGVLQAAGKKKAQPGEAPSP